MTANAIAPPGSDANTAHALRQLRVGVTGHRPNRLIGADEPLLRQRIHACLVMVREALESAGAPAPLLTVVSPLAEGSDRYVAEEALALGFSLWAPLPFARDEYERDFATAGSRDVYRALLDRAECVVELNGSREQESRAYLAMGRQVLDWSDLMIAVWDGREARGDGGTGQIVLEAIHRLLPTIWIRAEAPHEARLLLEDRRLGVRAKPLTLLPAQLRRTGGSQH